jgi:DNA-binding SARP family transcriptional activator
MRFVLDASKYTAPQAAAVVSRERLHRRLRAFRSNGLIMLLGQGAQGKTTLAADYIRRCAAPCAWMCLDAEDADSAKFHSLLLNAVIQALPAIDFGDLLEPAHAALGASLDIARDIRRLQELWQRLPDRIQIVIDGLEHLPNQAPSFLSIRHLSAAAATKGRLWLLSRRRPPFNYQQAVVGGQTLVLDNNDLAFNRYEIQQYFKDVHGLALPSAEADKLRQITDGWTGGLVLLSQAMQALPRSQWVEYLSHGLPDKLTGESMSYFSEEIFENLPLKIRAMLTRAAVLEVIEPRILVGLADTTDAAELLERIIQDNLFIHRYHDRSLGRTLYRFNQLFRSFLRSKFEERESLAAQRDFYRRIAEWYDTQGELTAAIPWYIQAQEYRRAAGAIHKIGVDLVIQGRVTELVHWLTALPKDQVQADPWMLFLLTLTRRTEGGMRSLADFETALQSFGTAGDMRGCMLASAFLIEANVLLGQTPAACLKWIEQGERLLAEQSRHHYYIWAKSLLWLHIGFGYIACGIDLAKGLSAAQNAHLLAHKMNNNLITAQAAIVTVLGLTAAGEFERADRALAGIGDCVEVGSFAEYDVLRRLVNAQLSLHRGDWKEADQQLKAIGRDIESFGMLFLYPTYVELAGSLQLYRQCFGEARDICRHLLDVAIMSGNPLYRYLAHRLSGHIHYFQQAYIQADAEAAQALDALDLSGPATLHRMRAHQLAAIVSIHVKKYSHAQERLDHALDFFRQSGHHLSLAETHLMQGLLYYDRQNMDLAGRHLSQGFMIATERRYEHFLILSPDDLGLACRLAMELDRSSIGNWAEHLLSRNAANPCAAIPSPEPDGGDPPRRRTVETARLDIRTFGGFSVSRHGNQPITDEQWGGHRPKLLLKAILAQGLREIPKEILIDDVWPDSTPRSGSQNFKVTLHRLRKILEPGLSRTQSSAFIHLKDNLVSLDRDRCRVDLEEFLNCTKQIKRHTLNGETDQILELGHRLMDLYRGDFLPEEAYAPWVDMKRWALRDAYIDILLQMVELYIGRGNYEQAAACGRAVRTVDPCHEKATRLLMRIYAAQGRRSEALNMYAQFCEALSTDLGLTPDASMQSIFEEIRGAGDG